MTPPTRPLPQGLPNRYRLERELGSGGMARVYVATDVRHGRPVAIKVLFPELSAMLGSGRFLKEIELTANLQHPHILPLFDSGTAEGLLFYVMPFVEGETLRARLERERQLPVADALRIAGEVADALEYAHQRGVVHRDIKPENILLRDGHALVADFGIALAVAQAGSGRMTQTGMSLGTPQYMSPEQAMGEPTVDARTDIYALGAVTYEMLVGEPPFTGPNAQAIVAKVMTAEPDRVRTQRRTVPDHVETAILTALEKLPADRFRSAAAFAQALAATTPPLPAIRALRRTPPPARWLLGAAFPGALAIGVFAGVILGRHRLPSAPATFRVPVDLAAEPSAAAPSFDLSPDGALFLYRARQTSGVQLAVRALDSLGAPRALTAPTTLTGASAAGPRFSPDGRFAVVGEGSNLLAIPVGGATSSVAKVVADSVQGWGVWGADGHIYFSDLRTHGIASVPAGGGAATLLTTPDSARGELAHAVDQVLPDGSGLLFSVVRGGLDSIDVALLDLHNHRITTLTHGTDARYVPPGYLLVSHADRTVWALPFDLRRHAVTGEPIPLLSDVVLGPGGWVELAVARNGTLLYEAGQDTAGIVLVDRDADSTRVIDPEGGVAGFGSPRVSPDGRQIVYERLSSAATGSSDIWVYNLAAHTRTRLTFGGDNTYPSWSRDGRLILFRTTPPGARAGSGGATIDTIRADGSGQPGPFITAAPSAEEAVASPDGRWVVVRTGDRGRNQNAELLYFARDDPTRLIPFATTRFNERSPAFSPDGRWLAYASDESGQDQIYLRRFPGPGARIQVSASGGVEPVWGRNGHTVYYRADGAIVSAALAWSPGPRVLSRTVVMPDSDYALNANHAQYDLLPGDTTMVLVRTGTASVHMILAVNWLGELERRRQR